MYSKKIIHRQNYYSTQKESCQEMYRILEQFDIKLLHFFKNCDTIFSLRER